jgi:hypothetical protein
MKNLKNRQVVDIIIPIAIALVLGAILFVLPKITQLSETKANDEARKIFVNENGLTYGSTAWGEFPDLVRVSATNGLVGYSYATELDGVPFNTPEEARKYADELRELNEQGIFYRTVPVYESDGVTVIGEHKICIDITTNGTGIFTECGERIIMEYFDGYEVHSTESGEILSVVISCTGEAGIGCGYDCCYEVLTPNRNGVFTRANGEVFGNISDGEFVSKE